MKRVTAILIAAALGFAAFAAPAQAHTVAFTAKCGSVTYNWSAFASSGAGNGGTNAPHWSFQFTPESGPVASNSGQTSFTGATSSLIQVLPATNGVVVASSTWAANETRDGDHNSGTATIKIADCPPPPPPCVVNCTPPPIEKKVCKRKRLGHRHCHKPKKKHRHSPFTG